MAFARCKEQASAVDIVFEPAGQAWPQMSSVIFMIARANCSSHPAVYLRSCSRFPAAAVPVRSRLASSLIAAADRRRTSSSQMNPEHTDPAASDRDSAATQPASILNI